MSLYEYKNIYKKKYNKTHFTAMQAVSLQAWWQNKKKKLEKPDTKLMIMCKRNSTQRFNATGILCEYKKKLL